MVVGGGDAFAHAVESVSQGFGEFVSGGYGSIRKGFTDVDGEAGYFNENFSLSLGLSRYNDPYYTSYNSFLNLTKSF